MFRSYHVDYVLDVFGIHCVMLYVIRCVLACDIFNMLVVWCVCLCVIVVFVVCLCVCAVCQKCVMLYGVVLLEWCLCLWCMCMCVFVCD